MSAVGMAGDPVEVTRTIEVTVDDSMHFIPDHTTVKTGETVWLFAKNLGKVPHEKVIGWITEFTEHAESNMLTLKQRQRCGIVWKFAQAAR
ncbi:hypothetical protein [Azospira restricta]|uniref:Uncharacterized protein n=1 Tax=Azospira restricta TaxID=404405 RepID=A0A974SQI4_9RHOO|nr:hypothetical protein [Azospira restricta]QRJ64607.1 hypothetical protein IWH25_04440 [Azospira restricta]